MIQPMDDHMSGAERRATIGLGAVFALRMLGMFMVLPVLTTYGMALQGATESRIGLAIGIYGLMQAIFQIPLGIYSDKLGRMPLIIGGLIIFALGSVVAATADSIWGIIIGRALQGAGAISAAVMALLSDLTREQHRTKAMAFIGMSIGVTFAIAMITGPIVTHLWGLSALFWGTAVLTVLAILTVLFVIPKPDHHVLNRESAFVRQHLSKVVTDPQLMRLNGSIFVLHAILMASFVALPIAMEQAGFPRSEQWKVYLFTMLTSFVAVLPFIIYAEKKRRIKQVFVGCVGLFLIAEAILLASDHMLWMIFVGIQCFFLAFNIIEALLPSLISKESPAGFKGTAMGIYSTCQFLGVAVGGAIGGRLLEYGGLHSVFVGALVLVLAWLAIAMSLREPRYVSSIRLMLNESMINASHLESLLKAQPGVAEVVVVLDEMAAYVKVDTKKSTRRDLEQLLAQRG